MPDAPRTWTMEGRGGLDAGKYRVVAHPQVVHGHELSPGEQVTVVDVAGLAGDGAVEAVARALYEHDNENRAKAPPWAASGGGCQAGYLSRARVSLSAVQGYYEGKAE